MKAANIFKATAFLLCFVSAVVWAETPGGGRIVADQNQNEVKVIRLHAYGGISPAEAVIKPGTTVVWVNNSRVPLELQFQGKQVTLACKSPVHFIVNDEGSFISNRIPEDSVASLCFVEKGKFPYVLRNVGGVRPFPSPSLSDIKEFRGEIIVQ